MHLNYYFFGCNNLKNNASVCFNPYTEQAYSDTPC